jgi:replicative DNA helicase
MNPKVPPHDQNAEVSVLGAVLIDPEAMIHVSDRLKAESFYEPAHQKIFEAMMVLYEKRQPIDAVTLTNVLKKSRKLKSVGGSAAIAELTAAVSTAANVKHYAKIVDEAFVRRSMISTSAELTDLAFNETLETRDILDSVEQRVFALSQRQGRKAFLPIKETLAESFERLDELQKNGDEMRGLPTGLRDLDAILSGLQKSNMIILAARPGMGKTALSLNLARHIAIEKKKKVGFFSLEMSREELVDRLLVAQSDVDAWKLKTGRLDQQDFLKISDAMGVLAEADLYIDDTPGLSVYEMRTKSRRLMMEHHVDMIIVDYLQLAHGRTRDNRVTEVGEISQGLKNIARELKVPVLALSQLSRAVESRGEKIPQLSHLRESGSIEQDADVVMFLYRKDDDIREAVSIRVAKHRNGPVGDIDLFFRGERMKFYGLESPQ